MSSSAFTHRVQNLEFEGAYAVLAAANEVENTTGKKVVHLEIGQPGFPTPDHVVKAGIEAINAGETKYSNPSGILQLKSAIASHVSETRNIVPAFEGGNVVVGPGCKPGIFFSLLALVQPGDEVIIPDPGFPSYKAMVEICGGKMVPCPLSSDLQSLDMGVFEASISDKTKVVIINSPSNPTGGVMPEIDLENIATLSKKHDFWVVSDEIYSQLVFDGMKCAPSIISIEGMRERTVVADGFSKTYSMTGWRLGYCIMPKDLAKRVELLVVHAVGCTATMTQYAGLAAIQGPQSDVQTMISEYQCRRDLVVSELNKIPGVSCEKPKGAFYAFADISSFGKSSADIASYLLKEGLVAVLPGTDFGPNGEGKIRLSYVSDVQTLTEGLSRIRNTLLTLNKK